MKKQTTFGVIIGNRGFFPTHLCEQGRKDVLEVLEKHGYKAIVMDEDASPYGSVESVAEARQCADLFKKHKDEIDGVLVTLPNFGDERAIANVLRWSELGVPVLLQASPDDPKQMTIQSRRDAFCGKMSAANNLRQYGIPYTLTSEHTMDLKSEAFSRDLRQFAATCRVVKGFKNCRVGAIGARPAAFNTVRYSEKLLEHSGISVEVVDLFEIMGRVNRLDDQAKEVTAKLKSITSYVDCSNIPDKSLHKMAKMGVIIDGWMQENELIGSAIQCWTAMEEFFGITPCTLMSMASNNLVPSACEVDIVGMLGMLALQWANESPSAIVDWNNNFGGDPDKCVIFHCSNLPKEIFTDFKMDYQEIIAGTVGKENTYGTVVGKIAPGPMSFCRVSTDDINGEVIAYVGEGEFTKDDLESFGGYGVIEVPRLQKLLRHACSFGFEHHVAVNRGHVAGAVAEAFSNYLGWPTYHHNDPLEQE